MAALGKYFTEIHKNIFFAVMFRFLQVWNSVGGINNL